MKRMVTYLYEYRNGMKGAGAGFLKLDSRGSDCRVQLCLQGKHAGEEQGRVYFVVGPSRTTDLPKKEAASDIPKRERITGLLLGDVTIRQGIVGGSWVVNRDGICGSPWSFADVEGMAVLFPSGRYLASCWIEEPDEEFLKGTFSIWREQESTEDFNKAGKMQDADEPKESDEPKEPDELQESDEPKEPDELQESDEPEEPGGSDEWASLDQYENRTDAENLPQQSEKRQEQQIPPEEEQPEQSGLQSQSKERRGEPPVVDRIDISDIRRFPKKNWHLCSNSFVIHGFFNYHYLVYIHREEDGVPRQYLGVPGVYARPERAMAMLFGFPKFEKLQAQDAGQQTDEPSEGTFGYWCCQLEI